MIKTALLSLVLALTGLCSACASGPFVEGDHYQTVRTPATKLNPKKVEIQEFFWYGCPHCYDFEDVLEPWLKTKPAYVQFERVPHSMGRSEGGLHAKAYHMAVKLRILDQVHLAMFKALYNRNRTVESERDICDVFVKNSSVTEAQCMTVADDPALEEQLYTDRQLIRQYGVSGVPTVVVDGLYISNASMAGSKARLVELMTHLAEKQKAARKIPD